MGHRLPHLDLGNWTPGRTNYLLLVIQLYVVVQGAGRGMDYIQPRPPSPTPPSLTIIEAALPLPLWGSLYLAAAGVLFLGLFGGWVLPIVAGHLMLAGLYASFAYGLLVQAHVASFWLATLGGLVLTGGMTLGIWRWRQRNWCRFALAYAGTLAGGWVTARGLGYDFRSGTGLLTAALTHASFSLGIAFIAFRQPRGGAPLVGRP